MCAVLGEGFTGVGIPGVSLGPSIILGWNATIVALDVTVWLVIGSILNFWVVAPLLYYSGTIHEDGHSSGVAVWPGGLNIYSDDGSPYSIVNAACGANLNASSCTATPSCVWGHGGHDSCSAGRIRLSSTMWLTATGICRVFALCARAFDRKIIYVQ